MHTCLSLFALKGGKRKDLRYERVLPQATVELLRLEGADAAAETLLGELRPV